MLVAGGEEKLQNPSGEVIGVIPLRYLQGHTQFQLSCNRLDYVACIQTREDNGPSVY